MRVNINYNQESLSTDITSKEDLTIVVEFMENLLKKVEKDNIEHIVLETLATNK